MKFFILSLFFMAIGALEAKDFYTLQNFDSELAQELKGLRSRRLKVDERPKSCPLEQKSYLNLSQQILNLKNIFEDQCAESDPAKLQKLLESADQLQGTIQNYNANVQDPNHQIQTPLAGMNTQALGQVVGGLNNLLSSGQCKFKDGTFWSNSADIIQNLSSMGLIIPSSSGVAIALGGSTLASMLRLIHEFLKKRFDFEKLEDRQNFIKLNCSFYNIRKQVEDLGLLDVATDSHRQDLELTTKLYEKSKDYQKSLKVHYEAILKEIESQRKKYIKRNLKGLDQTAQNLSTAIALLEKDLGGALMTQLTQLQYLGLQFESLNASLQIYLQSSLERIELLDQSFLKLWTQLDVTKNPQMYQTLLELTPDKYKHYQTQVQFHLKRIVQHITNAQKELNVKWEEETIIQELGVKKYLIELEKVYLKKNKMAASQVQELEELKNVLHSIVTRKDYSADDEGTENEVVILSAYDDIIESIYGKWGDEFLKFITEESSQLQKSFRKQYDDFLSRYFNFDTEKAAYNVDSKDPLNLIELCQDAEYFRKSWILAENLNQQGHDFILANRAIFHSDIPRFFLGRSNNRNGIHNLKNRFERIKQHHDSAYYALLEIRGQGTDRDLGQNFLKDNLLGQVMLNNFYLKHRVEKIQQTIEELNCQEKLY